MTTSGERIKEIRWILKLNQQQMADKLGLTQSAISAVEKNLNGLSNDNLVKLLTEYNINLNWLLGGEGEMFNSSEKEENLDKKVEQKVAEALSKYGLTDIIK
jgi:transcriptional regulator with XRE-family HTH domain